MILLADSGSTKCDWALIGEDGSKLEFHTMGFNPFYHSSALIAETLLEEDIVQAYKDRVAKIFFYGAGVSSAEMQTIVNLGLKRVFKNATVLVDHDLVGAGIATYDGEPCISCILGTGSNSCFFDGKNAFEEVPALAYILGDEGSGAYFGKKLLAGFLYKRLPEALHEDFNQTYGLTKEDIFHRVYMEPNPNVFLASFMPFFNKHRQEPYIFDMLCDGFEDFLKTHVCCYHNYREVKAHFIGSVAFYFSGELRHVANKLGITIGNIIQRPIDGLIKYHTSHGRR